MISTWTRKGNCFRRGIGNLEVVVATALSAFVVVGAMNAMGAAQVNTLRLRNQVTALRLVEELFTEIDQLQYEDLTGSTIGLDTGESGTTRANYDDIDDYNGLSESPPVKRNGSATENSAGFQRECVVRFVDPRSPTTVSATDTFVKQVIVRIKYREKLIYEASEYFSKPWCQTKTTEKYPRIVAGLPTINRRPNAVISLDKAIGRGSLTVAFSAAQSSDPDGDAMTYSWAADSGETFTGVSATYTVTNSTSLPIKRKATLTVTDSKGATDSTSIDITVLPNG